MKMTAIKCVLYLFLVSFVKICAGWNNEKFLRALSNNVERTLNMTTTTITTTTVSCKLTLSCPCSRITKDQNGCPICDCNPTTRTTTPLSCNPALSCPCPRIRDENGCSICDCNPITTPTTIPCALTMTCLGPPWCRIKADTNGCSVCECSFEAMTISTTTLGQVTDTPQTGSCPPLNCVYPCDVVTAGVDNCPECHCIPITTTVPIVG